jgi:pimeloyl-ACP methyl ester carboxylesterase
VLAGTGEDYGTAIAAGLCVSVGFVGASCALGVVDLLVRRRRRHGPHRDRRERRAGRATIGLVTTVPDEPAAAVVGSGDPIVLVAGSGSGPDSWKAVTEELAGSFEVWSFVRRGYTGGPPERAPRTFAAEVRDLRAILDAVGRPAHVVGASLGATLALHTARHDPTGIRSLILFEPPLLLAGPHVGEVSVRHRELVAAGEYRAAGLLVAREVLHAPSMLVEALAQAPEPEPEEAAREAHGWEADLAQLADDDRDITRWSAITLPTLILQGGQTWSPVPEGVEALARALPHAVRVCWPDESHSVTATAPELFAAAVADFARRH